jgi:uncharacterized SAM-dependent methyltransferase
LPYDDPLGVTAAFNRNLLVRINRELQGDFRDRRIRPRSGVERHESRVEMHLRARAARSVHIPGAGIAITLEEGERIWTGELL